MDGPIVPGLAGSAAAQSIYDRLIKKRNGAMIIAISQYYERLKADK